MGKQNDKIHVLHVLPALVQGGWETVISNIIKHSGPRFDHHMLVLSNEKSFAGEYEGLPVQIHYLPQMTLKEKIALARQADVVHSPNRRIGLYSSPFTELSRKPLVLALHNTGMNEALPPSSLKGKIVGKVEPVVGRYVVGCTEVIEKDLRERGWKDEKIKIIPNGIDLRKFTRSKVAGDKVRQELSIPSDAMVIGISAGYKEMKDIPNFIEAAKRVKEKNPGKNIVFLMCGKNMTHDNPELVEQLEAAGIYGQSKLLGIRNDMPAVYSAIDVQTLSSSHGEALSMALLEGTSCGCICVSTDAGDHKMLMQKTGGICVPPRQPEALAEGINTCLEMSEPEREAKRKEGRTAIKQNFNVARMAREYGDLFAEVTQEKTKIKKHARINSGAPTIARI